MKLVVGLGNPGEKYKYTRHNTGFIVLDEYAKNLGLLWKEDKKIKAEVIKTPHAILCKPQMFMNNSGEVVGKLLAYYKIPLADVIVIHDDVDLPFGEVKRQFGRGSAGHRGVGDIFSKVGSQNFWRIRVGVGKSNVVDTDEWVLTNFSQEELELIKNLKLEI